MSDPYNERIMERQRYIDLHPEEMTDSERWWREQGVIERNEGAARGRETRKRNLMALKELRLMADDDLRRLCG